MTEKEAEKFLEKEGFSVVKSVFVKNKSGLNKINLKSEWVAKASGKNIVHKKVVGGVILNVDSSKKAEDAFSKLKRIKGAEEVLFQEQLQGAEFLVGLKKTKDFGHVVVYGVGGSGVEEKDDFAFRVCPFGEKDAVEMMAETVIGRSLDNREEMVLRKEILKLSKLAEKFPKIKELDINPLMLDKNKAYIVDARIVFD